MCLCIDVPFFRGRWQNCLLRVCKSLLWHLYNVHAHIYSLYCNNNAYKIGKHDDKKEVHTRTYLLNEICFYLFIYFAMVLCLLKRDSRSVSGASARSFYNRVVFTRRAQSLCGLAFLSLSVCTRHGPISISLGVLLSVLSWRWKIFGITMHYMWTAYRRVYRIHSLSLCSLLFARLF